MRREKPELIETLPPMRKLFRSCGLGISWSEGKPLDLGRDPEVLCRSHHRCVSADPNRK